MMANLKKDLFMELAKSLINLAKSWKDNFNKIK